MRIGTIGTGRVAQAVARSVAATGGTVLLGSRKASAALAGLGAGVSVVSVEEAAREDVVLLAVPWPTVPEVLRGLPDWNGRILIDATNPFAAVEPELVLADLGGRTASDIVAELAPGARVVKAFNSIPMAQFELGPRVESGRRVLFVSGDDAGAKAVVRVLIEGFGFAVIDLGGLSVGGAMQQAGAPLAGPPLVLAD
jgi:predicted dinucleotide-binding enzyme